MKLEPKPNEVKPAETFTADNTFRSVELSTFTPTAPTGLAGQTFVPQIQKRNKKKRNTRTKNSVCQLRIGTDKLHRNLEIKWLFLPFSVFKEAFPILWDFKDKFFCCT